VTFTKVLTIYQNIILQFLPSIDTILISFTSRKNLKPEREKGKEVQVK
jgi:hypothetical protein